LRLRRRGCLKRAIGPGRPMLVLMAPNDAWSLDFVSDQLTYGRRFRILTVSMIAPRNAGAGGRHLALRPTRVAREWSRLMIERGKPKMCGLDTGCERPHQQRIQDMG